MAQHSLEQIFHRVAPVRRRGIPSAPTLTTGVTSGTEDLSSSLSQAGNEIAQLRAGYQQQADLILANTQALQNNTAGQAAHGVVSSVGRAVSGVLGGGPLGLLSPVISGLLHLFGSGPQAPAGLSVYVPPPPVSIGGILHAPTTSAAPGATAANAAASTPAASPATYAPQITVHVNAMDSQSFMDRSGDIASAVRQAMLNNHPINGVVADL